MKRVIGALFGLVFSLARPLTAQAVIPDTLAGKHVGETVTVEAVVHDVHDAKRRGIVYLNIGQDRAVKPGDIFIVYRQIRLDKRLYEYPKDADDKLKSARIAIGEVLVVNVGERGSTALVTYASDGLVLGDAVERR